MLLNLSQLAGAPILQANRKEGTKIFNSLLYGNDDLEWQNF